jgi:hypothetical protein
MLGESEMGVMGTVEGSTDAVNKLDGWQQPRRFDHAALAMHPFWARSDSARGS